MFCPQFNTVEVTSCKPISKTTLCIFSPSALAYKLIVTLPTASDLLLSPSLLFSITSLCVEYFILIVSYCVALNVVPVAIPSFTSKYAFKPVVPVQVKAALLPPLHASVCL